MSERSCDILETHGEDYKFPKDFGNGIVFPYKQFEDSPTIKLKSVVHVDPGKPREASLDIHSFLGSFGAAHHYAKISLGYRSEERSLPLPCVSYRCTRSQVSRVHRQNPLQNRHPHSCR